MLNEAVARKTRRVINAITGLQVDSVAWVSRTEEHEFAALVIRTEGDLERAMEFLTDPRNPYHVTRQTPTRIFLGA